MSRCAPAALATLLLISLLQLPHAGLGAAAAEPGPRDVTADDLMLSVRQDEACCAQAWRNRIPVAFHNRSWPDWCADLSAGTRITVVMTEAALEAYHGQGGYVETIARILTYLPGATVKCRHFLGDAAAAELAAAPMRFIYAGLTIQEATCASSMPLGLLLEIAIADRGLGLSYRPGKIVIGTMAELASEITVTRTFPLAHPWGSLWDDVFNGQPVHQRLDLLDTYTQALATLGPCFPRINVEDPRGCSMLLPTLSPPVAMAFSSATGGLTVSAPPEVIARMGQFVERYDHPSPEEEHATAIEAIRARLAGPARAAWAASTDAVRRTLAQATSDLLGSGDRVAAGQRTLLDHDVAAALPLLQATPADPAQRLVVERLLAAIDGGGERQRILVLLHTYFELAARQDLAAIREQCWSARRRAYEQQMAAEFAARAEWLERHPEPSAQARDGRSSEHDSYDQFLERVLAAHAPRVVAIAISGDHALVDLDLGGPYGVGPDGSPMDAPVQTLLVREGGTWRADPAQPADRYGAITADPTVDSWSAPAPPGDRRSSSTKSGVGVQLDPGGTRIAGFAFSYNTNSPY